MPSTPDPDYWGNPPQTPRSSNIPQQPMHHTSPEPPMGARSSMSAQDAQRPSSKHRSPLPAATEPRKQAPTSSRFPRGLHPPAPAAPPAPIRPEKKNTGIIVAIAIIAALLVGMGGCAACTAVLSATLDDADDARPAQSDFNQQYQNHNMPINEQELLNRETRTDFGLVAALPSIALSSIPFNRATSTTPAKPPTQTAGMLQGYTAWAPIFPLEIIGFPAINLASPPSISFSQLLREPPPTIPCTSIATTATTSWTYAKAKCSFSTMRALCSPSIK